MPGVGAGAGNGLSASAAPALLGAEDGEYLGAGAAERRKTGQGAGAEDVLGRACRCGAAGFRAIPVPLAIPLRGDGASTGAGSAGTAALLRLSTTPMAEVAHHQRDRALLRRSPPTNTTDGRVHQRGKRGPHHLCDFQSLQRGLEEPHPRPIYTSSLTSPRNFSRGKRPVTACASRNYGVQIQEQEPTLMAALTPTSRPNPERILNTMIAFHETEALRAAIALDIFTAISDRGNTSSSLAAKTGTSERGVRVPCDSLTSQQFPTTNGAQYSLTQHSALPPEFL